MLGLMLRNWDFGIGDTPGWLFRVDKPGVSVAVTVVDLTEAAGLSRS
jgi:hypothetical protein